MKDKNNLIKVNYDPFREGVIDSVVPTSAAQKEIWTSIKFESDATLCYNETIEIDLNGIVNFNIMEYAFKEVVKRHPILNSNFSNDGQNLIITSKAKRYLELKDLTTNFNALEIYTQFKSDLQKRPHRIESDQLFYGTLFKFSDLNYKLVIFTHHIVCDGWSYAIILNELSQIYSDLVESKAPILNEALDFKNYIEKIESSLPRQASKDFWKKQLKDYRKEFSFPTDFERKSFRTFNSERIDHKIDEATTEQFKKLCAKNGVSLYTGLISVYLILLNKISKQEKHVIGISSATQPALENNCLVGHFVNLLPYYATINQKNSFIELLKNNKAPLLDAFENQFITFGELVSELKIDRFPGEMPLISQVFNIDQQNENQSLVFKQIKSKYKSVPRTYENFEIFINAVSRGNFLELECQFNTNLFTKKTIANWLLNFNEIIELVLLEPNLQIENILLKNIYIPKNNKHDNSPEQAELKPKKSYNLKNIETTKRIWSDILFLDNLNDTDNFFHLGGHSLLAIELINKVKDELGLVLSMKDIFENSTVEEFSNLLSSNNLREFNQLPPIESSGLKEFKLSNSQMQIWYLEELNPNTQMHNLPAAIKVDFLIDRERLNLVFIKLIERHEALRTIVTKVKGRPVQKVCSVEEAMLSFKFQFEKLENDTSLLNKLHQDANHVFLKENVPLFKVKLYHIGNNQSVLFFMVHHAIWDGWCFDIFFEELNLIYSDLNHELPLIQKTYIDHSVWLESGILNGSFNSSLEYWKMKLGGELPIINLPIDYKRPRELKHVGKSIYFELTNNQVDELKKISSKYNTSLFNLFLTTFKITLLDFARENSDYESIVVGMPVRARTNAEVMNTIGFFVNTLAIKSEINFQESYLNNLLTVSNNVLEAYDHQVLPFQIILNNLTIDKENGRLPVFQTFFSYQDVSNREAVLDGHKYSQINVDKQSVHTELDLWIKSSPNKTEGAFEFDIDLFNEKTVSNIKDHFLNILHSILKNGVNQTLNDIKINKSIEDKLLLSYNQTESKFDDRPFIYKIDELALQIPNQIAIVDEYGSMTYKELKEKSDYLAHYIKSTNDQSELIGVSLNRSSNMLIAVIGILKANKGYVPLDPNFPSDRIEYMLSHSAINTIITENALESRFQNIKNIINVNKINFQSDSQFKYEVSPHQTAYVIYTSGSTGLPKGVELPHLAVSNFLHGMNQFNICSKEDRLLAVTTLSFDIAVLELYLPLVNGGTVVIANSKDVIDGAKLKDLIFKNNITTMQATPTTWRLLLQSGFKGKDDLTILCGGESFPQDLAHKLIPIVKRVLNMYGPTETTVWSSVKELKLSDPFISIGRPISNTTFYLFDEHMRLVPPGAIGQLFIGGKGLAKGYLNRPDLTRERFIPNPLVAGELIYATGDLARYTSNMDLICLGRNDGQVKVRGFRIELGEIESALQKFKGILESAAIVHDFGNGDKRIVAYYSKEENCDFRDSELKTHLSKHLPSYMLPSIIIALNNIPKTPNGKIDKKALPKDKFVKEIKTVDKSDVKVVQKNDLNTATNNDVEPLLKICRDLFHKKDVTLDDNFFDLGGNSLLAVELMARLAELFDKEIQLSVLLESKNLKEFNEKISGKNNQLIETRNDRTLLVPQIEQVFKSLVTIKNSGHKNPMFCFHGVGGNVLNYISLLPALNQERPLYAFQSIGLDGETEPLLSIEEMALHYYRELKILKAEGPYILAGGSMGGLIALEVARRLKAAGDEIEMLIMFDTFGPNFDLKKYQPNRKISLINRIYKSINYRLKIFFNLNLVRFRRNLGLKIPIKSLLVEIEHKNYNSIWNYHPRPYQGDIILIRSHLEEQGWYSDPKLGWDGVIAGNIEKHFMDGVHESFIENPELIKILKKILK